MENVAQPTAFDAQCLHSGSVPCTTACRRRSSQNLQDTGAGPFAAMLAYLPHAAALVDAGSDAQPIVYHNAAFSALLQTQGTCLIGRNVVDVMQVPSCTNCALS